MQIPKKRKYNDLHFLAVSEKWQFSHRWHILQFLHFFRSPEGLRDLGDQLKGKLGEGVVLLAAVNGEKVNLLAMATDAAQKAGAHAGNLIKAVAAIVGGGGGGRPNMAQAGGKNPAKAQEAVDAAAGILEGQIK